MQGIPNKIVSRASEHVQRYARYMPDSPDKPYYVRYPNEYSPKTLFSDDTWDLVEQLARIMNSENQVHQRR